jgi:hypothetical protein
MPIKGVPIALCVGGGIILYSGIKGATISDTVKALLSGNLTVSNTEGITQNTKGSSTPAGGGSTPDSGPVSTGTTLQNGTTIYKFLRSSGYTPMQAAGAIASMWGESTWNPESVGTGGCGLMGWTPVSSIKLYGGTCRAAGVGNASDDADMQSQLGAILKFVSANGDQGAVDSMKSASTVEGAANIWGPKVERFGINDVHAEGVATAIKIANSVDKDAGLR